MSSFAMSLSSTHEFTKSRRTRLSRSLMERQARITEIRIFRRLRKAPVNVCSLRLNMSAPPCRLHHYLEWRCLSSATFMDIAIEPSRVTQRVIRISKPPSLEVSWRRQLAQHPGPDLPILGPAPRHGGEISRGSWKKLLHREVSVPKVSHRYFQTTRRFNSPAILY